MIPGTVYWFTGIAGAGKTTLARLFYKNLKRTNPFVIFLDGDTLREIFGNDLGYTRLDRKKNAMRIARLCEFLSESGMNVVCATISLFHECQDWNRKHMRFYKEIYIQAPMAALKKRDPKKIYSRASKGILKDVWGMDLLPEVPKNPEVVIHNDGRHSWAQMARRVQKSLAAK